MVLLLENVYEYDSGELNKTLFFVKAFLMFHPLYLAVNMFIILLILEYDNFI